MRKGQMFFGQVCNVLIILLFLFGVSVLSAHAGVVYSENFESGWDDWSADNGIWQVGTPTAGPESCYSGSQCAGTNLDGNYEPDTDSRLISPSIHLPEVIGYEEIHLRFWQWFSYAGWDGGYVQVSTYDKDQGEWSYWQGVSSAIEGTSGNYWTLIDVDLSSYAGKKIKIAFYHKAWNPGGESTGWYIDDIEITGINQLPVIDSFTADPTSEVAPLTVTFTCTAHDPDGTIARYKWDFDGDGNVDQTTTTGTTIYTYDNAGIYQARVTVVDNNGATAISDHLTISVQLSENQLPVIDSFVANPTSAEVGEEVTFTCTAYDPDGDILLTYEWDFDGDGNVDQITSDSTVIHTYNTSSTYNAGVTVVDNDGARVVSDPITITVTGWQTHYSCSQTCEAQCGGDITCIVECSQYQENCCQDGLDICQPCSPVDPPSVHRVGLCDQGCQAGAPLKVSGGELDVCFNYTGSVNILAGVLSNDFRDIWWLRPDCSLYSNYSQAVDSGNGLSCQGISMPVEGGYLFWLVSPVDLSHLDWENGIYELLFYQVP
jgi:PKD repeat protein